MSQVPTHNLAVVATGIGRLTGCYQKLPKTNGLASAILASCQELENVAFTLLNGVNLNPAPEAQPTGLLLDNIAALVGLTRQGLTDAQLWSAFTVELLVLRSRGRSEDLLKTANAIAPTTIQEEGMGIAAFSLTSFNITRSRYYAFLNALSHAKDVGARLVFVYSTWPSAQNLVLATDSTGLGGANFLDSSTGTIANAGLLVASTNVAGV